MLADPLFLACLTCIGTACVISYLLGHYRGFERALRQRRDPYAHPFGDVTGLFHSGTFNTKEQSDRER